MAATPPALAALEVPTAGVPTYRMESPARATEVPILTGIPCGVAAGRATGAPVATAAAAGAAGAAAAGSPNSAAISSSFRGVTPFRLRLAFSAAMEDLLHFFPAATCFATSGLMLPETAAGVGGGATTEAGAVGAAGISESVAAASGAPAPPSQDIGTPALRASISASLNSGRLERLR